MFGLNLKKYRKLNSYSQEDIANKISVLIAKKIKAVNVQSWESGTNPKLEVIVALAEILDIPEQFLFDDSKEVINKIVSKEVPTLKAIVEHTKRVPLLQGYVGAGSAGIIDDVAIENYLYIDNCSIKSAYVNSDVRGLTVIGDSMQPYISENDIILFNPIQKGQYNLNDGKYIIETINGVMVKNLQFKTNGNIIISSCNKSYQSEEINKNESQEVLDILGIVVGRILKS